MNVELADVNVELADTCTSAPAEAAPGGMQKMPVTVPLGLRGGQLLKVQTPSGLMQVTIPQGLEPGQAFEVRGVTRV